MGAKDSLPREAGRTVRELRNFWSPMPTFTKVLCCFCAALVFGLFQGARTGRGNPPTGAVIVTCGLLGFTIFRVSRHVRSMQAATAPAGMPLRGVPTPAAPMGVTPHAGGATPFTPPAATYYRRYRRTRRHGLTSQFVRPRSSRDRVTELIGSLLFAAAAAVAATVIIMIVQRSQLQAAHVWLALTATAGAWGVLIPAKFWEGHRGDAVQRRFVQLIIGLALGLVAWMINGLMYVSLINTIQMPHVGSNVVKVAATHAVDGLPELFGFEAYFGFLFLVVRWWKQADPYRTTRLSVWATIVCVAWAAILNIFWSFPQPWGMMAAGAISVAVQLASPWVDPRERVALPPVPSTAA
jgi:hypothetical protein